MKKWFLAACLPLMIVSCDISDWVMTEMMMIR